MPSGNRNLIVQDGLPRCSGTAAGSGLRRRTLLKQAAAGFGAALAGLEPGWAQLEDAAAWALWDKVMIQIGESYYEPVDEAVLTSAAMDYLVKQRGAAAAKLKPAELGQDPAACRQAMRTFVIALEGLRGRKVSAFSMMEDALAAMMEQHLHYSHYSISRDVEEFDKVDKGQPGLKLERAEDGRFLCLPVEGGAAWRAGIRKGDELVAVEGRSVRGLALLRAGILVRGPVDSQVQVQVRQISGRMLPATLKREVPAKGEISLTEVASSARLRIPAFGPDTVKELKALLPKVRPGTPLIIDLQGNSGGDVMSAVQAAGLFLPGERPLPVAVRIAKGEEKELAATEGRLVKPRGITVLMDSGTASASELLIMALVEGADVPVTLSGSKTYGKGTFQVQQVLDGGGMLTLTTGRLKTAKGASWDGKGIEPAAAAR